jgi:hypothetical protein
MRKTEQTNGKESPQRWSRETKIIIVVGLVGLVLLIAVLISAGNIAYNTATPTATPTYTATPTDTLTMTTTAMTISIANNTATLTGMSSVTSEGGARRPRSISNYWVLCQTRKTCTLGLPRT